jgi:hypothetical protein
MLYTIYMRVCVLMCSSILWIYITTIIFFRKLAMQAYVFQIQIFRRNYIFIELPFLKSWTRLLPKRQQFPFYLFSVFLFLVLLSLSRHLLYLIILLRSASPTSSSFSSFLSCPYPSYTPVFQSSFSAPFLSVCAFRFWMLTLSGDQV